MDFAIPGNVTRVGLIRLGTDQFVFAYSHLGVINSFAKTL
jgi:hypothetical protein